MHMCNACAVQCIAPCGHTNPTGLRQKPTQAQVSPSALHWVPGAASCGETKPVSFTGCAASSSSTSSVLPPLATHAGSASSPSASGGSSSAAAAAAASVSAAAAAVAVALEHDAAGLRDAPKNPASDVWRAGFGCTSASTASRSSASAPSST
eukprot:scaffold26165_cov55-Phaeocystis_antarctica.AAC.2